MPSIKTISTPVGTKSRRSNSKEKGATYYQRFGEQLRRQIQDYKARRAAAADLFSGQETSIFDLVESGVTKHNLRYYQTEALYVLDYLLAVAPNKIEKKTLIEVIDEDKEIRAPFLGFEM